MSQKIAKKSKTHHSHSDKKKIKTEVIDIIQNTAKKSISTQTAFSQALPPLPIPPKSNNHDHQNTGPYYRFSNEIYEVKTPVVKQPHNFIPAQEQEPIRCPIIFQNEDSDLQMNCSSQISEEEDDDSYSNSNSSIDSEAEQQSQQENQNEQCHQLSQSPAEKQIRYTTKATKAPKSFNLQKQVNLNKKIFCNCKKTKCLKLYCDCFRLNQTCDGCNCVGCHNLQIYSEQRNNAILALMDRNPDPFGQKIDEDKHVKGCNCKKSNCLKKYCECYQAGLKCGQNCKCQDCKNVVVQKDGEGQEQKGGAFNRNTAKKQRKMVEI